MSISVYTVGRSGSGKSTALRYMKGLIDAQYSTTYIGDYKILLDMKEEPEHKAKFCSNIRGGFDIVEPIAFDIALERLLERIKYLKNSQEYDVIFIEFARRTYKEAFDRLQKVLQSSDYILFIEANLKTCIDRIDRRTTGLYGEDQHYISDSVMTNYFSVDNLPCMDDNFARQFGLSPTHLKAICNEDTVKALKSETKNFTDSIMLALKEEQGLLVAD